MALMGGDRKEVRHWSGALPAKRHSTTAYDFRSDTVPLPTPAMMAAIAGAALGDAARGDEPTVHALERLAARLVGKDDAVFVPSGTMANPAALLAHEVRGGEVVVEATAHLYNSEGGGLSVVAGGVPRPLPGPRGMLDPDDVRSAIRDGADLALAPTRLVCVENTHNAPGGAVLPLSSLAALHRVCRDAGIPVHMDGARLFNAAAFLDVRWRRSAATSSRCGSRCARGWAARSAPSWRATPRSCSGHGGR